MNIFQKPIYDESVVPYSFEGEYWDHQKQYIKSSSKNQQITLCCQFTELSKGLGTSFHSSQ